MDNKEIKSVMVRYTKVVNDPGPTKKESKNPGNARRNLRQLAFVITKLGEEQATPVTAEDMALTTGTTLEKFNAYLAGETPTPKPLFSRLQLAYAYLFDVNRDKNNLQLLTHSVVWIRNLGLARGMNITLEEMASKAGISGHQLLAYLRGENATPGDLSSVLEQAYKALLKNVHEVEIIEGIDVIIRDGA